LQQADILFSIAGLPRDPTGTGTLLISSVINLHLLAEETLLVTVAVTGRVAAAKSIWSQVFGEANPLGPRWGVELLNRAAARVRPPPGKFGGSRVQSPQNLGKGVGPQQGYYEY